VWCVCVFLCVGVCEYKYVFVCDRILCVCVCDFGLCVFG